MTKTSILLVDDVPANLSLLMNLLTNEGYEIFVAQSGERALIQAPESLPDIIILDVMMSGLDGFETCKRLKENEKTKHIPVIFMTALGDTVDKVKGFNSGGVDYITKPIQHEEVLVRIKTHLTIMNLQSELQLKNEQLSELNVTKDKFFNIIAHDLKNPFSVLLGFSQLLLKNLGSYDKEKIEQQVQLIHNASNKGYKLLQNLLEWSRLQTGKSKHNPKKLDLHILIEDVLTQTRNLAKQKSIMIYNLVFEKIFVYADEEMTYSVIYNLVSNAIKYTHKGGEITISSEEIRNMIEISVADTGIGITEDILKNLFRIDMNHSTQGTEGEEGTGLGLILSSEFIRKNGGKITVKTKPNEGSDFRFTLPRDAQL